MVFSSLEFLFFFLPLTIGIYFLTPKKWQNSALLLLSLTFYTWSAGSFVLCLILTIALNYCFGLLIESSKQNPHDNTSHRPLLWAAIFCNIALLAYFKYANFFITEFNKLASFHGANGIIWTDVILPIGISFFTFQSMSYIFDISKGRVKALRNPIDFALYVSLFPQLIAGPIVRYNVIEKYIHSRITDVDSLLSGSTRFFYGLCKKVIVADSVGAIADAVFSAPTSDLSTSTVWIGALAYTIQIYFDFSAYSDMAIGLGRIFGFRFPENFRNPYTATSITDFWRKWHITLSQWFRDYVYIPLGGSRVGPVRLYINLSIIFLLTGIWHGANWTFIIWGIYHGIILILERFNGIKKPEKQSLQIYRRCVTIFLILIGWVLFRSESVSHALTLYTHMFFWSGWEIDMATQIALTHRNTIILLAASLIIVTPRTWSGYKWLIGNSLRQGNYKLSFATRARSLVFFLCIIPYAILQIASGTFSPFLYFQF